MASDMDRGCDIAAVDDGGLRALGAAEGSARRCGRADEKGPYGRASAGTYVTALVRETCLIPYESTSVPVHNPANALSGPIFMKTKQ